MILMLIYVAAVLAAITVVGFVWESNTEIGRLLRKHSSDIRMTALALLTMYLYDWGAVWLVVFGIVFGYQSGSKVRGKEHL